MHAKEKKSEIRHFGTNKGCFTRTVLTRGLEVPITQKKKKKKSFFYAHNCSILR